MTTKAKATKPTKPTEAKVTLTKATQAAIRHVVSAFKAEDKAAEQRAAALCELADAVADWMREHPKASKATRKAYRKAVGEKLEAAYSGASMRARLSQVWRTAELAAEHGGREQAAQAVGAQSAKVDAIYRAAPKSNPGRGGKRGSDKTKPPTEGNTGLPLGKSTVEALTADDIGALTLLARGLAIGDPKRIAEAMAGIAARLDDKGRSLVKSAILAAV